MKPVINKVSHAAVAEAAVRLIAEVEARGLKLFTTIDHSGEARARGLELRETRPVMFGNPQAGRPIMQAEPLAGLDLLLKVPVRAESNRTCVSHTTPAELVAQRRPPDQRSADRRPITARGTTPEGTCDSSRSDPPMLRLPTLTTSPEPAAGHRSAENRPSLHGVRINQG